MSPEQKVEYLKKYKRVRAKDMRECDLILTAAWNQGIKAEATRATSGWVVVKKR